MHEEAWDADRAVLRRARLPGRCLLSTDPNVHIRANTGYGHVDIVHEELVRVLSGAYRDTEAAHENSIQWLSV